MKPKTLGAPTDARLAVWRARRIISRANSIITAESCSAASKNTLAGMARISLSRIATTDAE